MSRSSPQCRLWEQNRCGIKVHASSQSVRQLLFAPQVIFGINSSSLKPVEQFTPDVVVCLGSWVGIIKEVVVDLMLKFKDGSVCRLKDVDAELLQDLNDNREEVRVNRISNL